MSEEQKEILFDLLIKKAVYGLDKAEQRELDALDPDTAADEFYSLELTAAAISTAAGIPTDEPLPAHLYSKIAADAAQFVGAAEAASPWPPAKAASYQSERAERSGLSFFGWLGWAAAAVACIALVLNIWITRINPNTDIAENKPPVNVPQILTPAQMRDEMIRSTAGMSVRYGSQASSGTS